MSAWQTDEEPEFTTESVETLETSTAAFEEINEDVVKNAIEKAKLVMKERAKFEYDSWLNGRFIENKTKFCIWNAVNYVIAHVLFD